MLLRQLACKSNSFEYFCDLVQFKVSNWSNQLIIFVTRPFSLSTYIVVLWKEVDTVAPPPTIYSLSSVPTIYYQLVPPLIHANVIDQLLLQSILFYNQFEGNKKQETRVATTKFWTSSMQFNEPS